MRIISSSNRNRLVSSELTNVIYFRKENIELKLRSFAILNKFETKCSVSVFITNDGSVRSLFNSILSGIRNN